VDFVGALLIFGSINPWMAAVLAAAVVAGSGSAIVLGRNGKPLHRDYAERANLATGELVDVISNMWAVKVFSGRARARARLNMIFQQEAEAQRSSWFFLEKMRIVNDVVLWALAGLMLVWAIVQWRNGTVTADDVVVISALTFRVLHGSRDLATAITGTANDFAFITETL
jgi:ATP-binding cassette subfamily B protein